MKPRQAVRRVLIVNLHSARNAGDAVLLERAVWQLRDALPGAEITLALNDPASGVEVEGVRSVPSFLTHFGQQGPDRVFRWRVLKMAYCVVMAAGAALWHRIRHCLPFWTPRELRDLFQAYAVADIVVSCPGNIFFTMGRVGLPFLVSAFTTAYALLIGKDLYVMPQSIGPLKRGWERAIVRGILSRAKLVFAREPVSFGVLKELGLVGERYRLSPDLAFGFPAALPAEADKELDRLDIDENAPKVGVTVINRMVQSIDQKSWREYESSMGAALSRFHAEFGGKSIFFPQVTGPTVKEDDRVTSRRIVGSQELQKYACLLESPQPPGRLKAMYGRMDLFIATRMHSGIFAVSMGIPTLFIAYLDKTHGLGQMLGIEEWVLDIAQVNEAVLWEKTRALWRLRDMVRDHLRRVIPDLVERANQVGKAIAEDYYG